MADVPPPLLHAIAAEGGGHVALVVGAGCSFEPPTSLPLGAQVSEKAHEQLLKNGSIADGECPRPQDLAALATTMFAKEGTQQTLVAELPLNRFRLAKPNLGYKLLIALMAEQAVTYVLSLNFDLAVQNAAAELGCRISVVKSSGEAVPATATIIHLHGNAYDAPDDLVLRTEVLDQAWKLSWQQVIAQQVLAAPNVLFIGLGSPAPVLTETVQMIVEAIGNGDTFYQADIVDHAHSAFAAQLGVPPQRYIKGGWNEVMTDLAERVAIDHVQTLVEACKQVLADNGTDGARIERLGDLANRLASLSLLGIGKVRSRAKLDMGAAYVPRTSFDDELMAEPLSTLAEFCAQNGLTPMPCENGVWKLVKDARSVGSIMVSTGRGTRKLSALEAQIRYHLGELAETSIEVPQAVLLGGVIAEDQPTASPEDIVNGDVAETIISGPIRPRPVIANDATATDTLAEIFNAA